MGILIQDGTKEFVGNSTLQSDAGAEQELSDENQLLGSLGSDDAEDLTNLDDNKDEIETMPVKAEQIKLPEVKT
jgi:hypothetical protein